MTWIRLVLLTELLWIYLSRVWINERWKTKMPGEVYRVGLAGSLLPMAFFLAVLANALVGAPVTPGTYIVTGLVLPVAAVNLVAVVGDVRRAYSKVAAYDRMAQEVGDLEPCETPDCIAARANIDHIRRS